MATANSYLSCLVLAVGIVIAPIAHGQSSVSESADDSRASIDRDEQGSWTAHFRFLKPTNLDQVRKPATQESAAGGLSLSRLGGGPLWQGTTVLVEAVVRFSRLYEGRPVDEVPLVATAVAKVVDNQDITVPSNVMYVRFSKSFLDRYFSRRIDRTQPVRDTILGASVVGTSRLVASTELTLIDNSHKAHAQILAAGKNYFNTRGYTGPVWIASRGTTYLAGDKSIGFDGQDVYHKPARVGAKTETQTIDIGTDLRGMRGRMALRIATRREAESHEEAERISSEHTAERVRRAFEEHVNERLVNFASDLKAQYAKLPFEGRFALSEINCNTTTQRLEIVVLGRGDKEPVYAPAPPPMKGPPDIELHLHTALIQKALVNVELRKTLQSAVASFVNGPPKTIAPAAHRSRPKEAERTIAVQWSGGDASAEWLSLAWSTNGDQPQQAPEKTEELPSRTSQKPAER